MSAFEAFVAELAKPARDAFVDEVMVMGILEKHWESARAAWPAIDIDLTRFGAEIARRLGDDGTVARLEALRASDVYLAIACCDGNSAAIEACARVLAREVEFAAPKTSATPSQVADVTANLRRILFVDEPPRRAALREYSGRGDLKSYCRVMAIRDLIRAVEKGRREVPTESDDLLERLVPAHDPELSYLREQYRDVVDDAMRAAVATLDDRGRALLRYHLVDGWSVDRVGAAYGVHRATAARWIAAVRSDLGDKVRAELATRLRVPIDQLDSIVRLVRSRVDISLDRVLGPAAKAE